MKKYDHKEIERKWQGKWKQDDIYRSVEDSNKQKAFVLDMFPYPSGEGLHVGHPKGYIATDIYSRYMRMRGYSVLHPMGWDAFGLPAENYALKNKVHPHIAVEKNIANFKQQLAHIGFDYDWSREINTTDPSYYKWTQWIFLKLLEQGLAFQSNEPINWCPSCMTGLANEDLDGAVCERCGTLVEKKRLPQWVLKITEYADRMLTDLDKLDWPEHIKEAQRNWIGRSEGAEINFSIVGTEENIIVFTTRPDTIFGATYVVLAPEHPLFQDNEFTKSIKNVKEVEKYISSTKKKTERERSENKEKTGVCLKGISAINPATKEEIPIFVADFVLGSYGTGAVMAVPAHDERDFEFAKKFNLPIKEVVIPERIDKRNPPVEGKESVERRNVQAYVRNPKNGKILCLRWKKHSWITFPMGGIEEGEDVIAAARREIEEETGYKNLKNPRVLGGEVRAEYFAAHKDQNRVSYTTLVSFDLENDERVPIAPEEEKEHEAYWEDPKKMTTTHMVHAEMDIWLARLACEENIAYPGEGVLINSGKFSGRMSEEAKWDIVKAIGGKKKIQYRLRDWVFSRQRYWGEPIPVIHCQKDGVVPVPYEDLPVVLPEVESYEPTGTGESPLAAIESWVNTTCPKCGGPGKRETNTMPQWAGSSWYYLRFMDSHDDDQLVSAKKEKYWAPVDVYVGGDHAVRHLIYARFWHKFLHDIGVVSTVEPFARLEFLGFILAEDGRKMSKRYGNVINPDDVIDKYGADTFRIYEMFMGPFENTTAWSTASIIGTSRFVERLWNMQDLVTDIIEPELNSLLHRTIKKVGMDIEAFKFNTAVSQIMIFLNKAEEVGKIGKDQWIIFLRLLAPFAPHITEELWEQTKESFSIHLSSWPQFDENLISENENEIVVQVNGKRRGSFVIEANASEDEVKEKALTLKAVVVALAGKEPKRVVFVPSKIINLVV